MIGLSKIARIFPDFEEHLEFEFSRSGKIDKYQNNNTSEGYTIYRSLYYLKFQKFFEISSCAIRKFQVVKVDKYLTTQLLLIFDFSNDSRSYLFLLLVNAFLKNFAKLCYCNVEVMEYIEMPDSIKNKYFYELFYYISTGSAICTLIYISYLLDNNLIF